MADGTVLKYPPILLGHLGSDPKKKTVLVYGHLDVQPAHISDGWDSEPFELTEKNEKLYGRGSSDDKGFTLPDAKAHILNFPYCRPSPLLDARDSGLQRLGGKLTRELEVRL